MKKYILLFGLLLFVLFPSCSRTQNNTIKVEVEANVVKLLSDTSTTSNNKTLNGIFSELESESDTSVSSLMKSFGEKLKKKNLSIENFYNIADKKFASVEDYLTAVIDNALSEDVNIVKRRFENYGIDNASVEKSGSRRFTIELPAPKKESVIKDIINTKGSLCFYIVKELDTAIAIIKNIDIALEKSNPANGSDRFSKLINFELAFGLNKFLINAKSKKEIENLLEKDEVRKILPQDIKFLWAENTTKTAADEYKTLYFLNKNPEMTGKVISESKYSSDQNDNPVISVTMNEEGAVEWEKMTGANIKRDCAIVIDDIVLSVPRIMAKITRGKIEITGFPNSEETKKLAIMLKSGMLVIPLKIISENTKK
jgi:protein-export membrane protein SecD